MSVSSQENWKTARLSDEFDKRAIEALKRPWLADLSCDIEETDGFEDWRQVLYIFRLKAKLTAASNEVVRLRWIVMSFSQLPDELHGQKAA
jgi:hypothetical protein